MELQIALIKERQHDSIALDKQRGAYTGRKNAMSEDAAAEVCSRVAVVVVNKAALAREYNITRSTLYKYSG